MTRADQEESAFAQALAGARAGDPAAVERLLAQVEDRLRRCIDARLGNRLRASLRHSDVLQNSYLQMMDALPSFAGCTRDEFVSWLARIVEHDIRRQSRWFGAQKRVQPRTTERNALARILFEPPPTPSAEAGISERSAIVRRALERLEPDHARAIELALLDELPHREVAARMGRSEGACRMLLMRARASLAIALEQLAKDDP